MGSCRRGIAVALLAAALGSAGCGLWPMKSGPPPQAVAELKDAIGQPVGTATFTEGRDGITIVVSVRGIHEGIRAVHIHEVGLCVGPGFESAGDHFNPHNRQHGLKNPNGPHAGDLPNLIVNEMGRGTLTFTTSLITIQGRVDSIIGEDGTAVIVHPAADDEWTDPPGPHGGRFACGVVKPAGPGR